MTAKTHTVKTAKSKPAAKALASALAPKAIVEVLPEEPKVEEPKVEVPKVEVPKPQGVGALVRSLLKEGANTDEILVAVKVQFPNALTTRACVSWYRSDLKKRASKV